jgi:hypothetical protein
MLQDDSHLVLVDAEIRVILQSLCERESEYIPIPSNFAYLCPIPEIVNGTERATLFQKDVYAFGITAYEVSPNFSSSMLDGTVKSAFQVITGALLWPRKI